jgi:hypothetical protein
MIDPADLKRVRRVTILSCCNGVSSLSVAALAVILSLTARDMPSVFASLGFCTAATIELLGSARASRRDPTATRFLVASQAVSLVSVLALIIRFTVAINAATLLRWMPAMWSESVLVIWSEPGEAEAAIRIAARITLALLAFVTAIYETGVATYYATSAGAFARLAAARSQGE